MPAKALFAQLVHRAWWTAYVLFVSAVVAAMVLLVDHLV